ncbi:hypothetical protein ACHQM5_016252 [Ranunculus cassubicifolius]
MPTSDANSAGSSSNHANDPYFIHHSDNPTAVLVSPPLDGDNYSSWSRAMTIALRAKGKLGFIDGTVKKPAADLTNELNQWQTCNALVVSWIYYSVCTELRGSILYASTAKAMWDDLSERYSQTNAPKIYQLKQFISSLKQDNLTVSAYYTKLKALWDELNSFSTVQPCTCGNGKAVADSLQQDMAMEFLQGLNDRFAAIRSQVLLIEPLPTVNKMYSLIRQEEQQQELHSLSTPIPEAAALFTSSKSNNSYHRTPHRAPNRSSKPRLHCDHCGRDNHTKDRCYKLIGYPPRNSSSSDTKLKGSCEAPPPLTHEQYNKLMAMMASGTFESSANLAGPVNEEDDWTGEHS